MYALIIRQVQYLGEETNSEDFIEINAKLAKVWPIITAKKDALPNADDYAKQTDKKDLL